MNTNSIAGLINPDSNMVAPRGHGMGWRVVTSRKKERLARKKERELLKPIKSVDVRKAFIKKNPDGTGAVTYISSDETSSASSKSSSPTIRSYSDAVKGTNTSALKQFKLVTACIQKNKDKSQESESSNLDSLIYTSSSDESTCSDISMTSVIKNQRGTKRYHHQDKKKNPKKEKALSVICRTDSQKNLKVSGPKNTYTPPHKEKFKNEKQQKSLYLHKSEMAVIKETLKHLNRLDSDALIQENKHDSYIYNLSRTICEEAEDKKDYKEYIDINLPQLPNVFFPVSTRHLYFNCTQFTLLNEGD